MLFLKSPEKLLFCHPSDTMFRFGETLPTMHDAHGVYFETDQNKLCKSKKGVFTFKYKNTNDALQLSDKKLFHILHFLLLFWKYDSDS